MAPLRRARPAAALALAAAAVPLAVWTAWIEPRRLVVRERTLELPGWPATLAGLRVALLTDLHGGVPYAGRADIARWVDAANAAEVDVVALGGDFVDSHPFWRGRLAPGAVAEELARLQPRLGAYAVLGNHDWKAVGRAMWAALEGAGITVLENRSAALEAPGGRFHVAGLADMRMRTPDVEAALADVPEDEPVLLLSHDPDLFPLVPPRVALTVAGHLHAGQVAIPVLRRPVIPSLYGERYARGHVVEHGRHLYVSSGLGTSGLPLRLLAPPEIVVLTLGPAAPRARGSALDGASGLE